MLRLLTYLSFIVFVVIITSCSQQHNETKKVSANESYMNLNNKTGNIKTKNTNSIYPTNTNPDTSLLYHAKIKKNIGSLVNHTINEVALVKANVPQKNIQPEITNLSEPAIIEKSPTIINIVFDNDIFNNTDYYYTNGVNIELITPLAKRSPLSRLLAGLSKSQINLYGFSLKQNIYTPTNPDIDEISIGDRPFSAFLTIGQFRESYNLQKKISIKSSINFGVIGPASLGGVVQSSIHDIEPIGWNNQIKNNIVIDYSIKLEKGIISTPHAELNLIAGGNIGTIFNKLNGGFYFRAGSFIPVFKGLATIFGSASPKSVLQYWFFVSGQTNLVFYDATLQGGLFNNSNPYVIRSENINRLVANLSIGFAMYYKKVGVEIQNFYLSPEFKNAYDFRWGRIKLVFQF